MLGMLLLVPVTGGQAIGIPEEARIGLPGAAHAQRLVLGHISREATDVFHRQAHIAQDLEEILNVVAPAQPSAMRGINVYLHLRNLLHQLVQGVLEADPVSSHGGGIPAMRVPRVRGQVRQAVRLQDDDDRHVIRVFLQHLHERVHVILLVLLNALRAIALVVVVAMAVLLGAADLTDGCLCIAVTVGHVVPDQSDQRHRVLLLCVLQDALDALRGVAVDLVLFVDPIRGAHLAHRLQVLADFLGLHGLHGVLIPLLIQGVNIVRHVLEGVLARGLQKH
mmetsp:Transcript_118681/g.361021  ORF Transcript_118681/g.361021 Transcript_118681/m.361021 type:complete len:279 (+) Transcript_118681:498-1334(+)